LSELRSKQFIFEPSRFMQICTCLGLRIVLSTCLFLPISLSSFVNYPCPPPDVTLAFTKVVNTIHLTGHLFNDDLYLSRILIHFLSKEAEVNHKFPVSNLPVVRSGFKRRSSTSLYTSSALPLQQCTG